LPDEEKKGFTCAEKTAKLEKENPSNEKTDTVKKIQSVRLFPTQGNKKEADEAVQILWGKGKKGLPGTI